jgi:hypothetical protein
MEHLALHISILPVWVLRVLAVLGIFEAARLIAYIIVALSRELRRQMVHTCVALSHVRIEYRSWRMILIRLRRVLRRFRRKGE